MNIYADRGNIAVLERRLAWRGSRLEVTERSASATGSSPGGTTSSTSGGGQDRDQAVVADDMVATKAEAPPRRRRRRRGRGAVRLRGVPARRARLHRAPTARRMPGVGILDLDTVAGPTRLIGDLVIEADLDGERHGWWASRTTPGRTRLGPGMPAARPGGQGHGNNGDDGGEGGCLRAGGGHLSPRAAPAEEPLARRPPDRLGARPTHGRRARAGAARRLPGGRGARGGRGPGHLRAGAEPTGRGPRPPRSRYRRSHERHPPLPRSARTASRRARPTRVTSNDGGRTRNWRRWGGPLAVLAVRGDQAQVAVPRAHQDQVRGCRTSRRSSRWVPTR